MYKVWLQGYVKPLEDRIEVWYELDDYRYGPSKTEPPFFEISYKDVVGMEEYTAHVEDWLNAWNNA